MAGSSLRDGLLWNVMGGTDDRRCSPVETAEVRTRSAGLGTLEAGGDTGRKR